VAASGSRLVDAIDWADKKDAAWHTGAFLGREGVTRSMLLWPMRAGRAMAGLEDAWYTHSDYDAKHRCTFESDSQLCLMIF